MEGGVVPGAKVSARRRGGRLAGGAHSTNTTSAEREGCIRAAAASWSRDVCSLQQDQRS